MKEFEILVIGAGTAGSAAAKTAAEMGAHTAAFNDGELGGLCILRGCMPTKTMLHAAHLAHEAQHSKTPGVHVGTVEIDFPAIMANKDVKVARFQRAKINAVNNGGYEVIDARATFLDEHTLLADGEKYRFTKGVIVATGSTPHIPNIPGIDPQRVLTSDDVMRLQSLPKSVTVIGSGAIGLELAQFFSRLGTKVTLVSRTPVFSRIDPLLTQEMEAIFRDEPNFELFNGAVPIRVAHEDTSVRLTVEHEGKERVFSSEALLVATGRTPDIEHLHLEKAGIAVKNGKIVVGNDMRTTNPKVFAAGDANGQEQLLHVANWEGAVAGKNAVTGGSSEVEQRLRMSVVFTDPPAAFLGRNESELRAQKTPFLSSLIRFPETGRAITMDTTHGLAKVLAHRETGEILGAQVLGPRADDIIHVLSSIMYYRGTAQQMLEMPWYHPTLSEVLLTIARDLQRQLS